MRILVTGGAGFIGSHLCERLLSAGHDVVVVDNFNDFYDPDTKRGNIEAVVRTAAYHDRNFILCEGDIRDADFVYAVFAQEEPEAVIHLAAAAGVRPSIENPLLYEEVNVRGTMHILEAIRSAQFVPFVFASSSSVYGDNPKVPFAEDDRVDNPISPYAATKKAGELLCHTYHHLYGINVACLRFFTVYGPRQRPDLAIYKFTRLILDGKPVPFYGDGTSSRDYTYVDDIVDGVVRALQWVCTRRAALRYLQSRRFPSGGTASPGGDHRGGNGGKALIERLPMQPGDVRRTFADIAKSSAVLGYEPRTAIEDGLRAFVRWYRQNLN